MRRRCKWAQLSKWDLDLFDEYTDDDLADSTNDEDEKVDMVTKIAKCMDALYFNPAGTIPGALKDAIQLTSDVDDCRIITYEIDNFSDLLDLEVYRMIAEGLRIKRCKNCHLYFVVEKPNQEGCSRILDGSTKTCAEILRSKVKERRAENPQNDTSPYDLYRTAYKTRAARVRKGAYSQNQFDHWKKDGLAKKALVEAGQLDVEEYKQWLKQ